MPGDTKPHRARMALKVKRARKAGDLAAALLKQWRAVLAAEAVMFDAAERGDRGTVLSAVHAMTQANAAFAKLVEVGELEGRLAELEKAEAARKVVPLNGHHHTNGRAATAW